MGGKTLTRTVVCGVGPTCPSVADVRVAKPQKYRHAAGVWLGGVGLDGLQRNKWWSTTLFFWNSAFICLCFASKWRSIGSVWNHKSIHLDINNPSSVRLEATPDYTTPRCNRGQVAAVQILTLTASRKAQRTIGGASHCAQQLNKDYSELWAAAGES